MPESNDDNDADVGNVEDQFLEYLGKLGGKCQPLQQMIDQRVKEVFQSLTSNNKGGGPETSGSYLEQQNKMLLNLLFSKEKSAPSGELIPDVLGQTSEKQLKEPESELGGLPAKPVGPRLVKSLKEKAKPFWK